MLARQESTCLHFHPPRFRLFMASHLPGLIESTSVLAAIFLPSEKKTQEVDMANSLGDEVDHWQIDLEAIRSLPGFSPVTISYDNAFNMIAPGTEMRPVLTPTMPVCKASAAVIARRVSSTPMSGTVPIIPDVAGLVTVMTCLLSASIQAPSMQAC